jgi:hypothetical protein
MSLYNIAAAATDHLLGRLLRRALLALVMAAFAIVAIYHFTIAGMLALAVRFGDLQAQLIVAAIYTALAAISYAILWAMGRKNATPSAPGLSATREMQLAMLVEAAMLGFSLTKKGKRAR